MTAETKYADATYLYALCKMDNVANGRAIALFNAFRTPDAFIHAPDERLTHLLKSKVAEQVLAQRDCWDTLWQEAVDEIERHLEAGITPLALTDPRYPRLLHDAIDRLTNRMTGPPSCSSGAISTHSR